MARPLCFSAELTSQLSTQHSALSTQNSLLQLVLAPVTVAKKHLHVLRNVGIDVARKVGHGLAPDGYATGIAHIVYQMAQLVLQRVQELLGRRV